ncbi:MAG: GCN5-like N-acetyltransferase [Alphaproteobacteria bacterium]|nr:MAG: GCN5-like N-acetyltransferase [Caulobacteraceae bacterium]TPW06500.1 MAG: GCN5-like N-acetyltransferase [Alphaproteobacteria bacterium]
MCEVKFRKAEIADVPALHALVESAYRGESAKAGWTHEADLLGGQRTDEAALRAIIVDAAQSVCIAAEEDDIHGCVLVSDKGAGRAYLGMLTVRPDVQAGGLGRALLAQAERHAREALGATVMEMTVIRQRRELIDWYLRRGYVDTGRQEPFPLDDERFGLPKTRDLVFVVLAKRL